MAENSDSYVSKFKPHSHFFTNPSAIVQSDLQAFGPVSENVFRLTSKFTVSGASNKAFAICKGIVLVQPQTGNANAVNIIIRPYIQPIAGLNIKYFIYRGLIKSDFFANDLVIATGSNTSDFINKLNASFLEFHKAEDPVPVFLAKFIGYDPTNHMDSLMLSNFFFKESAYVESNGEFAESGDTAYELPLVEMGASLGNFIQGECGMDIVLNYGDYKLPLPNDEFLFDLAYARSNEATIELAVGLSDFEKKLKREHIFQFIDAAAYFGFHCIEGGIVEVNSGGVKTNKKGVDIYNDVINKFFTKNNIYLYIQSDRTRSYNFYGNYKIGDANTNSLKMGMTEATMVEKPYGTMDWPLIIDNVVQTHGNTSNKLFLQLVTDNNVNTMLYGQVAQIDNAQHNNFCNADYLKLPNDLNNSPSIYTKAVEISNPSVGPDNAKLNIATFNVVLYQGKIYKYKTGQPVDGSGVTTDTAQPNFFDDVFDLINGESLLVAGSTGYSTMLSQKLKLINHYYDNTQYGISTVQTTIVEDTIDTGVEDSPTLLRITYVTESIDMLNTVTSLSGTVSNDTKSFPSVSGSVAGGKTYRLPEPFYYNLISFTDSTQLINGMKLKASDDSIPNKIILGLTKSENDLLRELIFVNNIVNPRLFLLDLFGDGNQLISIENILYQKYRAGIVGELSGEELKLYMPPTDVMVYSLDRKYHFTHDYAKYVKEDIKLNLALDLDISL